MYASNFYKKFELIILIALVVIVLIIRVETPWYPHAS